MTDKTELFVTNTIKEVSLAPLTPTDEDLVLSWLNDKTVCHYNSHGVFPAERFTPNDKTLRLGIIGKRSFNTVNIYCHTPDLIGVIALQKINWVERSAELAILIGERGSHRKGVGTQAARLMVQHGFDNLNLHRIYCGTHQDNIGMQKVALAIGMTEEGRRRQAFYKHGCYADIIEYGILKEEFEAKHHAHCGDQQRTTDELPD